MVGRQRKLAVNPLDEARQKLEGSLDNTNWAKITEQIHQHGYATIPKLLSPTACEILTAQFSTPNIYRKTVVMERYRFGLGRYKYWDYPLPTLPQLLREKIYPQLVPVANLWMQQLKVDVSYPETYSAFQAKCWQAGQTKPTPLILKYGPGGFNTLHQDLYGEIYFPIQLACFLSDKEKDYTGGEFVLTQQQPRAQSKAIVLTPGQGDLLIFATNFRPVLGNRGYYRVTMKHGVSEVKTGERYAMGIIFHDAES